MVDTGRSPAFIDKGDVQEIHLVLCPGGVVVDTGHSPASTNNGDVQEIHLVLCPGGEIGRHASFRC